ncbi:MAG TPA: monovalent cation/H(+) antiporter subunit G [Arenibaculum sp.]|nr:monovalent cation/H(+) antiporter subunit G [Arenibaculum sp.]
MSAAGDLLTAIAVLAGIVFFVAGTAGLLRFPDVHTRLHAMTKADNLGLGLIVLGLLPQAGDLGSALKMLLVWGLSLLAAATVTQLVARHAMAYRPDGKERPWT